MTANAPLTCAAAIDVPLSAPYPPKGSDDAIDSPGASSDNDGATLEKDESRSALVVEPTLIADDTHAGDASADVAAAFPDATTVAMPTALRLSTIALYGSSSHAAEGRFEPRLRLIAAIL